METGCARRLMPLFVAISLILLFLVPPPRVHSAGIVVNTLVDALAADGKCSLREAINQANINTSVGDCSAASGADTITFSVSGTIRLTSYLPSISDAAGLTIDGAGQNITISGDENNDGVPDHEIFNVSSGASLTLRNLTLSKGKSTSSGGAIYHLGVNLNVTSVTFTGNEATGSGGAIYIGSDGWLTIDKSTFISNSTSSTGSGGAIYSASQYQAWVTDSTFSSNSANYGGAIALAGTGPVTVRRSTSSGNHAAESGGAIFNYSTSALTISNDTFSANSANRGGAVYNQGGTVAIVNSTFSGNGATTMGGAVGTQSSVAVPIRNTILAASSPGSNCATFGPGSFTNWYNNIDSGSSCGFASNYGSHSDANAQLLPLANNGGPTLTFALSRNSPALDGVVYNSPNFCPSTDQRGWSRPIGTYCDIGAYEAWLDLFLPLLLK